MNDRRAKLLILIIIAVNFTGCVNNQKTWIKEGASQQDFATDRYECERDARQSGYFGTGLVGMANMSAFAGRCMQAHGWQLESSEEQQPPMQDGGINGRLAAEKTCLQKGLAPGTKEYSECFFNNYSPPLTR